MIIHAQLLLLTLAIIIIALVALRFRQGRIGTPAFLFWIFLWVSAAVVVVYPDSTSVVARFLGIGRGADLVLYLGAILILYLIFRLFMRMEQLDRNITTIVRSMALREAGLDDSHREPSEGSRSPGPRSTPRTGSPP